MTGSTISCTWDKDLLQKSGEFQGREAIAKGVHVVLGPTVNIQRGPLGGRGFESFSEDPFLSGILAAATVRGMQSTGVSATMKHFVCNDQEHERTSADSIVTERALREIYLMPFMIVQRDADPWCYMTSYNRVNGTHASENPRLLQDILRNEFGFGGLIMSDWLVTRAPKGISHELMTTRFGTYSTVDALKAGLDLEMPGIESLRKGLVSQALSCGKLTVQDIDACVMKLLQLIEKIQGAGIPENAVQGTNDTPESAAMLRRLSAEALVLMKNDVDTLPFVPSRSTAVIGPLAATLSYCGGGSSFLPPYYEVTPLQGLRTRGGNVRYELGAEAHKVLPPISRITCAENGEPGLTLRAFLEPIRDGQHRQAIDELHVATSFFPLLDYEHPKITTDLFWLEFTGTLAVEETLEYAFGLTVAGTGKIFPDGECIVDNETDQQPGESFFGVGSTEKRAIVGLERGRVYKILVTFGTLPTMTFAKSNVPAAGTGGLKIGAAPQLDPEVLLRKAIRLAKEVDQVVLCVGLDHEWECEGYDRRTMDLPPGTDRLVREVLAANPNTAVVIQSGTPVTVPWADTARAIVYAGFGGNEGGNAISDVIFGAVNPSGKLSLSWPMLVEDNPAYLHFQSDRGQVLYGEGVYVGYRYYEKANRRVRYPFGHGLSYTNFDMHNLSLTDDERDCISVSVDISNQGNRAGAQVVQVYISQERPSIGRPPKELKGFEKVYLEAGATKRVSIAVSKRYATSTWDVKRDSWIMEKGVYEVLVGDSSAHIIMRGSFSVPTTQWWKGL